jgi:hypothetical protein
MSHRVDSVDRWDSVIDVLDLIDKEAILTPAQVLAILSINPDLPLYVVSDYVSNTFKELQNSIVEIESGVSSAATNLQSVTFSAQAENEIQNLRAKRVQDRAQRKARLGYDDDDDDDEDDDLEEEMLNLVRNYLVIRY